METDSHICVYTPTQTGHGPARTLRQMDPKPKLLYLLILAGWLETLSPRVGLKRSHHSQYFMHFFNVCIMWRLILIKQLKLRDCSVSSLHSGFFCFFFKLKQVQKHNVLLSFKIAIIWTSSSEKATRENGKEISFVRSVKAHKKSI